MKNEKDLERKFGLMGRNMKETGKMIRQTEKEFYIMQTGMFMTGIGETTRLMEEVRTRMQTERLTRETGWTTNKTAMALKRGQTGLAMKGFIKTGRNTAEEN